MCAMSMIGDHYQDKWQARQWCNPMISTPDISRKEFDELKAEVVELKALLKRAKKYDEDNGEPDCEMADKMAFLRQVAKLVGVTLDDVLKA